MATKFQLGDRVTTKYGEGSVIYITPPEKLFRTHFDPVKRNTVEQPVPQSYHVEIPHVGSYEFSEAELTLAAPEATPAGEPAAAAHAPAAS